MPITSPWKYYYAAKDALQMVEAYFVFNNKEDLTYAEFDALWRSMKNIGNALAENVKNDRKESQ